MLRAAVLTAVPVLVTGGIHLDGYLDTMDALSSWREKQRRLEILKDQHAEHLDYYGMPVFCTARGRSRELVERFFRRMHHFAVSRSFSGLSIAFFPNANPKGTAAAFGMSAEKKRTAAVLVVMIFATALSASFWRLGGTGCTGCIGTGILVIINGKAVSILEELQEISQAISFRSVSWHSSCLLWYFLLEWRTGNEISN